MQAAAASLIQRRFSSSWNVTPAWSVNLSHAKSLYTPPPPWRTLGVTVVFGQ